MKDIIKKVLIGSIAVASVLAASQIKESSALGYEVTFGKAIIDSCTSKNGSNNISGATLSGNCIGF